MKIFIERHQIGLSIERLTSYIPIFKEKIQSNKLLLNEINEIELWGFFRGLIMYFCESFSQNNTSISYLLFRDTVEIGKIIYQYNNYLGKEITITFGGVETKSKGRHFPEWSKRMDYEALQTTSWVNTLHVAIIARHQPTIKTLCTVANDDLVTNHSRNTFTEVNFFKALLDNQGNPREFLAAIFKEDSMYFDEPSGFEMSKLHNGFKNKYVDRYYYQLSKANFEYWGYEAVLNKDKKRFNELLLISLQMHKAVWDTVEPGYTNLDYRNNALGWVSLPLLALCSFAFDNGIEIEVGSDYIPEWLYKGEFERWD